MQFSKSKYKKSLIAIITVLIISGVGVTAFAISKKVKAEKQYKIELEKSEKENEQKKDEARLEIEKERQKEEQEKIEAAKAKEEQEKAEREAAAKEKAKKEEEARERAKLQSVMLNVPTINQYQYGLANGCEAMAALMGIEYKTGQKLNASKFAMNVPKDPTPVQTSGGYDGIVKWGSPSVGFVGDITGKNLGSTIYPKPLARYINSIGYHAVDISGSSVVQIEDQLKSNNPVVAWVSIDMSANHPYNHWATPYGYNARVTLFAHAVTLTGMDSNNFYYNDSLDGSKNKKISKQQFANVYQWRGERALAIQ